VYLLALIPHRDAFPVLRAYRRVLFAGDFEGTYAFPLAVPLAVLPRPFSRETLKRLAGALRTESLAGGRDGKFRSGTAFIQDLPELFGGIGAFLGIYVDIRLPPMTGLGEAKKGAEIQYLFPRPALCAALIPGAEYKGLQKPIPPVFSFRAAALANINFSFRPLSPAGAAGSAGGYASEWETGPLVWLPNYK
jgi:hypothetical protein